MELAVDNVTESAVPKNPIGSPEFDEQVKENQSLKDDSDVEDDEEVLKVFDTTDVVFEEENVTSPELVQISDEELSIKSERSSPKQTIEQTETISGDTGLDKTVGGLINNGHYSRLLFVGDFRLQHLEKTWPSWHYVKPQFLFEPELTIDGIKDFILSRTEVPHLENGTLLMCSVGIHDIIAFNDYEVCKASADHTPMKLMVLKEKSVEDLIKLIRMRLDRTCSILEELLGSSSIVCFAAVIPCDPILFFIKNSEKHSPKSHAVMSSELRNTLNVLKDKIQLVCERINKHLSQLAPLPSLWDIMVSYHVDRKLKGNVFQDGLSISHKAADLLSNRLNRFLQELFYGVEINNKFLEFSSEQEVIVVGDSRLKELQNMWSGDAPMFYCEPEMGFYNLEHFIEKHLVGLKNKIVLVCLGLNDLVNFINDYEFRCENHDPIKRVISLCHKYDETPQTFVEKILTDIAKGFNAFKKRNSSLMFFATVYPIHVDIYWNYQQDVHKKNTEHIINPPENISKVNEGLKEVVSLLNYHLRCISQNLLLPVWDMFNIVCRGEEATSLSQDVLKDGIFPSERTSEELISSYHRLLNEKLRQDSKEDKKKYKHPTRPPPPDIQNHGSQLSSCPVGGHKDFRSLKPGKGTAHLASRPEKDKKHEKKEAAILYDQNSRSSESQSFSREPKIHASLSYDHKERESPPKEHRSSPGARRSFRSSEKDRNSVYSRNLKGRYTRSPERFSRSRASRSPEKLFRRRSSRSPRRRYSRYPREDSPQYLDDSERSSHKDSKASFYSKFMNLQNSLKRECQREKRPIICDALLDLCASHLRECEMYVKKPDAHPDYAREYRLFLETKKRSIYELGGDPGSFDFTSAWGDYWPSKMLGLFEKAWKIKRDQCIRMLESKRRRSPSSSSSSSSSSHKKEIRLKKSPKNVGSKYLKQKSKRPLEYGDTAAESFKTRTEDDLSIANIGKVEQHMAKTIAAESLMSHYPNQVRAHNEMTQKESVKVVEVFGVLAYMKDKLGVFGMPVNVLYEKAVELKKKGLDPNQILNNEETATLLGMLSDKLRSLVEEEELSAIQKAIYLEAQSHLQDLMKEYIQRKLKRSPEIRVNIHKLAFLTMGKSISQTVDIISSLLLYEGYSDVSRKKLETIFMAVKDEQLKINHSVDKLLPRERSDNLAAFVNKSQQLNHSHKASTSLTELTEEFFIGKRDHTKLDALLKHRRETSLREGMFSTASTSHFSQSEDFSGILKPESSLNHHASSVKFDPPHEYDEEFFTGSKFSRPPIDEYVDDAKIPKALPHQRLLIPPAPIISDSPLQSNSARIEIDFEAVKSCLEALRNKQ